MGDLDKTLTATRAGAQAAAPSGARRRAATTVPKEPWRSSMPSSSYSASRVDGKAMGGEADLARSLPDSERGAERACGARGGREGVGRGRRRATGGVAHGLRVHMLGAEAAEVAARRAVAGIGSGCLGVGTRVDGKANST